MDSDWPKLERAARRDKHHGHRVFSRCVLQDLLARSADFPRSGPYTIAAIGWLCPERMAELERLLVEERPD